MTKWAHKFDDCVKEMEKMRKLRCFLSSKKMWFVLKSLPHEVTLTGKGSKREGRKVCCTNRKRKLISVGGKTKVAPQAIDFTFYFWFWLLAHAATPRRGTNCAKRTTLNKRGESVSNEGETFDEFRAKLSLLGGAKKRREKSSL